MDLFEQFRESELVPIAPIPPIEQEASPPEVLVSSADCPAKVYRVTQPTLFDCSDPYQ